MNDLIVCVRCKEKRAVMAKSRIFKACENTHLTLTDKVTTPTTESSPINTLKTLMQGDPDDALLG